MHDLIRLLLAALALTCAAVSTARVRRAEGGRPDPAWPYAEPVCILIAAALALGITYLL